MPSSPGIDSLTRPPIFPLQLSILGQQVLNLSLQLSFPGARPLGRRNDEGAKCHLTCKDTNLPQANFIIKERCSHDLPDPIPGQVTQS
jgi:hypothetical protein